jgi:phosphatidylglycerophosphate synthase
MMAKFHQIDIQPTFLSKLSTAIFMGYGGCFIFTLAFELNLESWFVLGQWLIAFCCVATILQYTYIGIRLKHRISQKHLTPKASAQKQDDAQLTH